MVNMKDAVEGVKDSLVFGGKETTAVEVDKENADVQVAEENTIYLDVEILTPSPLSSKTPPQATSSRKLFSSKAKEKSAVDLIETEIKAQEQMVDKMSELVDILKDDKTVTKDYGKRISRSLEKIVDFNAKMLDLKGKKLNETKRHHMEMEKLKVREIENQIDESKKLIELKQMKCSLMGRKQI